MLSHEKIKREAGVMGLSRRDFCKACAAAVADVGGLLPYLGLAKKFEALLNTVWLDKT